MGSATAAGAFHALVVFLIGFTFGTIRVLVLAPRLGGLGRLMPGAPEQPSVALRGKTLAIGRDISRL